MRVLLLGGGKTGALVAQVAGERLHSVKVLRAAENPAAAALTPPALAEFDLVLDFTTPAAAVENINACVRAGKSMVVGTTGWYEQLPGIRQRVEAGRTGFLYGANFSVGVNLFYDIAQTASEALARAYCGRILERHHAHKKDAPSGTAVTLQKIVFQASGVELAISSVREGEAAGVHEVLLDSAHDTLRLTHESKSRRGFAEGAVRAAEWLHGKHGFFNFQDIWRELAFDSGK